VALGSQLLVEGHGADLAFGLRHDALAADLEHGRGVQGGVRARPGVGGGREVVRVRLALTRKTVQVIFSATLSLEVNHSPSAQDCMTRAAAALPASALALMS
jgi:hypothetical protein